MTTQGTHFSITESLITEVKSAFNSASLQNISQVTEKYKLTGQQLDDICEQGGELSALWAYSGGHFLVRSNVNAQVFDYLIKKGCSTEVFSNSLETGTLYDHYLNKNQWTLAAMLLMSGAKPLASMSDVYEIKNRGLQKLFKFTVGEKIVIPPKAMEIIIDAELKAGADINFTATGKTSFLYHTLSQIKIICNHTDENGESKISHSFDAMLELVGTLVKNGANYKVADRLNQNKTVLSALNVGDKPNMRMFLRAMECLYEKYGFMHSDADLDNPFIAEFANNKCSTEASKRITEGLNGSPRKLRL